MFKPPHILDAQIVKVLLQSGVLSNIPRFSITQLLGEAYFLLLCKNEEVCLRRASLLKLLHLGL